MSSEPRTAQARPSRIRRIAMWTAQSLVLFGVWLAFSGHLEREYMAMGALAAIGATMTTHWLFAGTRDERFAHPPHSFRWAAATIFRLFLYLPWLAWEIFFSNLHVAAIVLDPRLPIRPSLVEFETSLKSEHAQVLFANSITLTPGTVTVDASDGTFLVHCLSAKSRYGLENGSIQRKVAAVFQESAPDHIALREITDSEQVHR